MACRASFLCSIAREAGRYFFQEMSTQLLCRESSLWCERNTGKNHSNAFPFPVCQFVQCMGISVNRQGWDGLVACKKTIPLWLSRRTIERTCLLLCIQEIVFLCLMIPFLICLVTGGTPASQHIVKNGFVDVCVCVCVYMCVPCLKAVYSSPECVDAFCALSWWALSMCTHTVA